MEKYKKYVFVEAHRKYAITKKHGNDITFAEHLKNSWFMAKLLNKHKIAPYTNN